MHSFKKKNVSEVRRVNGLKEVPENTGPVGTIHIIHRLHPGFSTISKIPLPSLSFGVDLKGHELVELSSGADASFLSLQTFLPAFCSNLLASESQSAFWNTHLQKPAYTANV